MSEISNADSFQWQARTYLTVDVLYRICHARQRSVDTMQLLNITGDMLSLLSEFVDMIDACVSTETIKSTKDGAYARSKDLLMAWKARVNG